MLKTENLYLTFDVRQVENFFFEIINSIITKPTDF